MKHFFEAVALLGLAAAAGAQTEAAKPGRQMDNQNRGSAPPAPKPAPNLRDPGANIAQRLLAMTPEHGNALSKNFRRSSRRRSANSSSGWMVIRPNRSSA